MSELLDIRQGRCPLCNHDEIIESEPRDHHGDYGSSPLFVAEGDEITYGQRGILLRYVCRSCGYCQTFAKDPEAIAIGDEYNTRLVGGPGPTGSPFR